MLNSIMIVLVLVILAKIAHFSLVKTSRKSSEQTQDGDVSYSDPRKKKQEIDREVANFRRIYREVMRNKQLEQEQKEQLLSEWDRFSLEEVLQAQTVAQLKGAKKLVIPGSLAARFVPIKHEQISMLAVEVAGSDVEKLIQAAARAPKGGEAEELAFSKLVRLIH